MLVVESYWFAGARVNLPAKETEQANSRWAILDQHQGSSTIDVIFVSNEARHFFVTRHAPIRREMIN